MSVYSLLGRENEYSAVHSFIHERLTQLHCKSLFIFGACGCGKTSTILRAMRRVSHRLMVCDKEAAASKRENTQKNGKSEETPSPAAGKGRRAAKRSRDESIEITPGSAVCSPPPADDDKDALCCTDDSEATIALRKVLDGGRRVQCHYVNCADMTTQQMCDAIVSSFRLAQPRIDAQSRQLLDQIETLQQRIATSKRRGGGGPEAVRKLFAESFGADTATGSLPAKKTAVKPLLHVLALDEVEYVRAGGRNFLTALAALSVEYAAQLALVFISNQRELVHVPQALLKELPFEAYSAETLERIGAAVVENAKFTKKRGERVLLSPALIAYIAKKSIHEFSGDVRQVAAMCRRLVYNAQQEGGADELAARVEKTPQRRGRASGGGGRASGGGGDGAAPCGSSSPATPAAVVTLAESREVLRGPAVVADRVFEFVAGMPEQMLYVLSCLVVLTLRQRGETGAAGATQAALEPGTFTMRGVHRLYSALMGRRRFPSMNATGIAAAIDGFADLGIISRPQRRGNEELFSFNGTWSLESMQAALTARGEALRQEQLDCGLDGSENRFSEVIHELKAIIGL